MKKTLLTFEQFEKFDIQKQADIIERETKELLKRLPTLKKELALYDDVSDELYNLTGEELSLFGKTYANAILKGEITSPSSRKGYNQFVRRLLNYNQKSIKELASEYATKRIDSFYETIQNNGSLAEQEYAKQLLDAMSEEDKVAFTRSKYYLDTDNWSSEQFMQEYDDEEYSMMTLKLELFMQSRGYNTDNIYNQAYYGEEEVTIRPSKRGGRVKRK